MKIDKDYKLSTSDVILEELSRGKIHLRFRFGLFF